MICITESRLPIVRRGDGYFIRWYYNGWHYWLFYPGKINFVTEGEKYRTLGTQKLTVGSGQVTQEQCDAIRTIMNATEISIYTDSGWGIVRVDPGSWIVYDHGIKHYEAEISIVIGSKYISRTGFSPAITVPGLPPTPYVPMCGELIIGTKIWMACNYDVNFPGSKVYNNDEANRTIYGGLYSHSQVLTPGFCPFGWRVPTEEEWDELIDYVGDSSDAGGILKQIGTTRWTAPNTGATDDYDFTALPGGFYLLGFNDLGETAYFWSTKTSSYLFVTGQAFQMKNDSAGITKHLLPGSFYCSVRLIKDASVIDTGLITDVVATAISDTEIDLSWVNHYVGATNNVIEYSTDGVNYTILDTVAAGDTTYSVTGLTATTRYYFRIYFTVGVVFSLPSNVANDWTAFKMVLASKNTGAGVSYLRLKSSANIQMTIDGNGKFYDDSAGTTNEGTDRTITNTLTYFYVKVPSGNANVLVFSKNNLTGFGIAGNAGWDHTGTSDTNNPSLSLDIQYLPKSVTTFFVNAKNTVSGNISNLPTGLTYLRIVGGTNTVTGNIAVLPTTLTFVEIWDSNTLSGSMSALPSGITYFSIQGSNTISGNLSGLASLALTYFLVYGSNTITGNVDDLPATLDLFYVFGSNTIYGDIANLPASITQVWVIGSNTLSGNLQDIPNSIYRFRVTGQNTIAGDFTGSTPRELQIDGYNTIDGVISGVYANQTIFILNGNNTTTGDLADFGSSLIYLAIGGLSQISTYTAGNAWNNLINLLTFVPDAGYGLSSSEVDDLLIDLSACDWAGAKTLTLTGGNAARTAASNAAVLTLQGKGVTVTTNP